MIEDGVNGFLAKTTDTADIVDAIENLTPPELYNLCFLAEEDNVKNEEYYDLTRGA